MGMGPYCPVLPSPLLRQRLVLRHSDSESQRMRKGGKSPQMDVVTSKLR